MIDQKVEDICVPETTLKSWQEIVDMLAQILDVPAALIMRLKDPDIEVFASSKSTGNPYRPGDREHLWGSGLYCETVIRTGDKLLVPDALADETWKNNPDVKLHMISYLGLPIFWPKRRPFGTICVLDNKTNEYPGKAEALMMKFRNLIESNLELIYMNQTLGDKNRQLSDYLMEIQAFRGIVPICSNCKSIRDGQGNWHPIEDYLIKQPQADFSHGICPKCMKILYPEFDRSS
jgi:GAF domain-containing protein